MANVNGIELAGAASGSPGEVRAVGSDTDVSLKLVPQGAGSVLLNKRLGDAAPQSDGYVDITGSKSNADYTLLAAEYTRRMIRLGWTGWSGGHNVVVPLVAGAIWWIINATGQTATVIGATGTGIAVANAKVACVACDGTNIIRLTADT